MTILDSNVVSALMNDFAEPRVVAWVDRQARGTIWISSVTVFEIQSGLQTMPIGRRQSMLAERFNRILEKIEHRVASFDEEAASLAANLIAARKKQGKTVEMRDTMIAGIVLARGARLATRNVLHFEDIRTQVVDPWGA